MKDLTGVDPIRLPFCPAVAFYYRDQTKRMACYWSIMAYVTGSLVHGWQDGYMTNRCLQWSRMAEGQGHKESVAGCWFIYHSIYASSSGLCMAGGMDEVPYRWWHFIYYMTPQVTGSDRQFSSLVGRRRTHNRRGLLWSLVTT